MRAHRRSSKSLVSASRRPAPAGARTRKVRLGRAPRVAWRLRSALCNAASIQMASSIHGGGAADGLRRMVANRVSACARVNPSRISRRSNSDQSPLAHERHHAARRRAGEIGIALLTRQGFEISGQELVDGCSANDQAFVEGVHPVTLRGASRLVATGGPFYCRGASCHPRRLRLPDPAGGAPCPAQIAARRRSGGSSRIFSALIYGPLRHRVKATCRFQ